MRSLLSVARSGARDSVERAIQSYQAACDFSERPLERCWDKLGSATPVTTLASLVKEDLQRRFDLGERPRVAEYLEMYPILAESSDRVVSLVYEEFCLLQEHGENPDSHEFCNAYKPWRDSLLSQLAYHRELSRAVGSEPPSVKFPSPGEQFDKYQLCSILGTGGVARVYLATEDDLGGRKVAIKVSASFGQEPSILGKLDHHNIVPILTVASSESGLRGICMPYRPGITLERLIRRIGRGTPPRSAQAIWDALEPNSKAEDWGADDFRSGWDGFPIRQTFSDGVAWIGLALANALTYLHGQGVFHRDIKPANVLLAYREGPQLLDFNLAQDPSAPEHVNTALKGGTLPYMSPEQLKAFIDPSGWKSVDATSDIYSLGLVLKELVTGQAPDVPSTRSSLPRGIQNLIDRRMESPNSIREINPSIPPTLVSIIEKCLSFHPQDRYEDASDLAEDLRLFLARKPLKHAPNCSKTERFINWNYRNRILVLATFAVLCVSLIGYCLIPPSSIREMSEFQHAEQLLDAGGARNNEQAAEEFGLLAEQYPTSAWPTIYQAVSLEKLGGENTERASDLFQKALKLSDLEEVLSHRLQKEPGSAILLMNMGILLKNRGDHSRAKDFLLRSLRSGSNGYSSLINLADIERKSSHPEEALRLYEKAALIGRTSNVAAERIYGVHRAMLPLCTNLAEKIIDGQEPGRGREAASHYLDQLEAALEGLKLDWNSLDWSSLEPAHAPSNDQLHESTVQFYEGCLASLRAAFAADSADQTEAIKLYDAAKSHFDDAFQAITLDMPDGAKFHGQLKEQRRKLEDRRKRYALASKLGPTAPGDNK